MGVTQCPGTPGGGNATDARRRLADSPGALVDPLCRAGHAGPRCYACAQGYGLQGGLCFRCPAGTNGERDAAAQNEFAENVAVLLAASALVLTVVGVVTYMNIRAADRGRSDDDFNITPFVKILINYLQASTRRAVPPRAPRAVPGECARLTLARDSALPSPVPGPLASARPPASQLTAYAVTFPLQWPARVLDIFEAMRRISYPPVQLKAIDCQFSNAEGSIVFERFLLCARDRPARRRSVRSSPVPTARALRIVRAHRLRAPPRASVDRARHPPDRSVRRRQS